ncbi:MAG: cysteine hydrolase [Desulfobacteraceae bacterium]|nr:cysteine hydrolase [Desulfobacteraceae bacterium]
MNDTALLLIDIQNDYFPGGKMELEGAVEAGEKAAGILARFRERKLPVFHIRHESVGENAAFFLPGTDGQKINGLVAPEGDETVIVKNFPNSFAKTGLLEMLKAQKIEKLVVTGMMTFMCVDATTRAAKDLGFDCTLIHDATAARALEFNGRTVTADQVKTSFFAALAMVCDRVTSCGEFLKSES